MSKIVVGLLFGLALGAMDGATAWFYPETHSVIASIMSSIKGMIVGVLSGWFARKVQSTYLGNRGGLGPRIAVRIFGRGHGCH
jgi:hypothetical protein